MAVYAISDTHFGHENIIKKYSRTHFQSIEEHDNAIKDNILRVCGKRDTLYILGDICFNRESLRYIQEINERVENLYVLLGNHDGERSGHPKAREYLPFVTDIRGPWKYKKKAWLSHFPVHESELRGKINIHGHIHDINIDDNRYVNVSCENTNYMPIELEKIFLGWRTNR